MPLLGKWLQYNSTSGFLEKLGNRIKHHVMSGRKKIKEIRL